MTAEDGFYKLRGHSIYYERNQMMQDYMIHRKDVRRVESGAGDTVIRDFRQRMEENKKQVDARRSAIRVLGSLCSFLTLVILAGGVAMFNNYEKMKDMEAVLASALPDKPGREETGDRSTFTIEEIKGNLNQKRETAETYESQSETGRETMAALDALEESRKAAENQTQASVQETAASLGGNATADESYSYQKETESQPEEAGASADPANTYTVQDGETLYGICLKLYGTGSRMEEICKINGLDDEDKIISGQNLLLP